MIKVSACGCGGALGGTRTPNFLIRSKIRVVARYGPACAWRASSRLSQALTPGPAPLRGAA